MKRKKKLQYSTAALKKARAVLKKRGLTRKEFAKRYGVKQGLVEALLQGKVAGNYGESHRIAVAVGLKKPVRNELPDV